MARAALAEHLYSSDEAPKESEMLRCAWRAISRHVHSYRRFYGLNTHDRYAGKTVGFERFWISAAAPARGPEDAVLERTALWQIWAELSPTNQKILTALAVHDSYEAAAEALGKRRETFTSQVGRARREFLALWHEGEQPSRPWGYDRRKSATATSPRPATYVLRNRKRQLAKRAEIEAPPRPRKGKPKKDLGITRDELERRYQNGETIRNLAASLGCGFATLQRRLHAEGIEVRSTGNSLRAPHPRKPKKKEAAPAERTGNRGEGYTVVAVIKRGPHNGRRIEFPEKLESPPQKLTVNQHVYALEGYAPGEGWLYYDRPDRL